MELVSRRLIAKAVSPQARRQVLVCLTRAGLAAHNAVVTGVFECNQRLLEGLECCWIKATA